MVLTHVVYTTYVTVKTVLQCNPKTVVNITHYASDSGCRGKDIDMGRAPRPPK